MQDDFKAALARVQSDYAFYIQCQSDPSSALEDYALTAEERAMLSDPERLAELLRPGGDLRPPSAISITISGTHDWVNRAAPRRKNQASDLVAGEVENVMQAGNDDERDEATLRLIRLLG